MAPRARRCVILLALAVASSQDAVDWLSLTDDIERSSLLTVLVRPPSPLPRAKRERASNEWVDVACAMHGEGPGTWGANCQPAPPRLHLLR